ncbi:MAG: Ig-like domain-containing protein, partial [Verrucomicrobiota bacterium]
FPSTNYTVAAQSRLAVALVATDADLPAQVLSYSLVRGPAGLTVSTNGLLEWTPPASAANTTNVVSVAVRDGVTSVTTTVRILVRPVGSGAGSEAKVAQRARLSLQVQPDQSLVLRAVGPVGARYQVESTSLLGVEWQAVKSLGVIETQGDEEPVDVPLPADEAGGFRQFRLRKL